MADGLEGALETISDLAKRKKKHSRKFDAYGHSQAIYLSRVAIQV
ncbi:MULTISPECIES: hypothetical protein [Agrobacterium]|nr:MULTISPECIES: hypothetical protein [Agrobacterium]MDX8316245.1 hypothetical protein [Agrobacterium rosae]